MGIRLADLIAYVSAEDKDFQRGMKRVEKTLEDVTDTAKRLGTAMSLAVTAPLIAVGKQAVDAAVSMDSLKRGLTAVAGSSEEAETQLKRLREVAKLPGLGFKEAIQGSINLQAAGFAAETAERSLKAFGNALVTVGKGKAELDGVTLALTQIKSKGIISAEEINQLQERVPQIRRIMVEAFGTANTEILQKAKITADEFINTILPFFERMPQATGGAQNALENFKQTLDDALTEIGKDLLPEVTRAIEAIEPKIKDFIGWWKDLTPAVKNAGLAIAALGATGGPALLALGAVASAMSKILGLLGSIRKDAPKTASALAGLGGAGGAGGAATRFGAAGLFALPVAGGVAGLYGLATLPQDKYDFKEAFQSYSAAEQQRLQNPAYRNQVIGNLQKQATPIRRYFEGEGYSIGAAREQQMRAELREIEQKIEALRAMSRTSAGGAGGGINAAARAAAEEARKQAAEDVQREAKRRQQEAAQARARLGDLTAQAFLSPYEQEVRDVNQNINGLLQQGAPRAQAEETRQKMLLDIKRKYTEEALNLLQNEMDEEARIRVNGFLNALAEEKRQQGEAIKAISSNVEVLAGSWASAIKNAAEGAKDVYAAFASDIKATTTSWADKIKEAAERAKDAFDAVRQSEANDLQIQEQEWIATWDRIFEHEDELLRRREQAMNELAGKMRQVFGNALRDLLNNGFKGFFQSVIDGFRNMLIQMAIDFLASQLMQLLMAGLSRIFGGGFGDALASIRGRAAGGYVAAGTPYLVGEHGPELFLSRSGGQIVPNDQLAGAGGINIVINVTSPDANSFKRTEGQIGAEIKRSLDIYQKRKGYVR